MATRGRERDNSAVLFETWYGEAWPRLVAAVALDTRHLQAAEDAVAGAMAKAIGRWDDGSIKDPDAWVYRVAINEARRSRRPDGAPLAVGLEPTAEIVADPDLWAAVAELPERQRRAVVLRYLLDLTQGQVARELAVAPGTAAALLNQARTRLREMKGTQR